MQSFRNDCEKNSGEMQAASYGVAGNNKSTVMKDYVQLYKEFSLMIDPKLYLCEIRDYLERDLGLNGPDLPSIMTIQRFIAQRGFTRKKCTRVAIERFRPENILRREAFIEWRKTVDLRQFFLSMRQGLKILLGVMVGHLQTTHFHPLHPK